MSFSSWIRTALDDAVCRRGNGQPISSPSQRAPAKANAFIPKVKVEPARLENYREAHRLGEPDSGAETFSHWIRLSLDAMAYRDMSQRQTPV